MYSIPTSPFFHLLVNVFCATISISFQMVAQKIMQDGVFHRHNMNICNQSYQCKLDCTSLAIVFYDLLYTGSSSFTHCFVNFIAICSSAKKLESMNLKLELIEDKLSVHALLSYRIVLRFEKGFGICGCSFLSILRGNF